MDSFLEVKSSRNQLKVNYNGIKLKNVDKNLFHLCLFVYLNFNNDVTNGKSKANDKKLLKIIEFPCNEYVYQIPTTQLPTTISLTKTTTTYFSAEKTRSLASFCPIFIIFLFI